MTLRHPDGSTTQVRAHSLDERDGVGARVFFRKAQVSTRARIFPSR